MKILHREVGYMVVVLPGETEASLIVSKGSWENLAEISGACEPSVTRASVYPEMRRFVELHRATKRMLEDVSDFSLHLENQARGDGEVVEGLGNLHLALRELRRIEREREDKIGGV